MSCDVCATLISHDNIRVIGDNNMLRKVTGRFEENCIIFDGEPKFCINCGRSLSEFMFVKSIVNSK